MGLRLKLHLEELARGKNEIVTTGATVEFYGDVIEATTMVHYFLSTSLNGSDTIKADTSSVVALILISAVNQLREENPLLFDRLTAIIKDMKNLHS